MACGSSALSVSRCTTGGMQLLSLVVGGRLLLPVVIGGNVGPRIVGRMEGLHGGVRLIDLQAIKIYYETI